MQSPNSHNAQDSHFDPNVSNEDFIEQMLNTIPSSSSWPDLIINNNNNNKNNHHPSDHLSDDTALHYDHHDQSASILASKLRQHQINGAGDNSAAAAAKMMLMQQQQQQMMMMPRSGGLADNNNNMLHMPLGMNGHSQGGGDTSMQALFNGLSASLHGAAAQHFNHPQSFSAATSLTGSTMNQSQASGSTTGAPQQPRQQRVRARRGQATDPHSIAERLRRERIAERMKSLQELVPNANKTDKASMLDEIIDYVKFLQLQVKVLSMSRLGGAASMAPLVADMSSEGNGGDCIQASANAGSLGSRRSANGNNQTASSNNNDNLNMTEHQVAKLMEEDMGQAMQYLQGKGLCLMPISLATAISTSTASRNRNNLMIHSNGGGDCPTSPNMSVMTVQSASMANGGGAEGSVKDATSVSKS